jgi:hypothetical protein
MAEFGTFGEYLLNGVRYYTVERPWLDNAPSVSCIPQGTYICKNRKFHRGGYDAIEITNVPGRSHILFHKANLPMELAGCVAPTSTLGVYKKQWAGLNSSHAFRMLMKYAQDVNEDSPFVPTFGKPFEFTLAIYNRPRRSDEHKPD